MTRTPAQALAVCAHQSEAGPAFRVGTCLIQCHNAYAIASDGTPSAAAAWASAKYRHPTSNSSGIPVGAFVFWTGGSKGFGHIAISAGNGWCWSSDIDRPGYFDRVPISLIAQRWPGHTFVGWTEDVDGVRVLNVAPPAPPAPAPEETRNMALLADLTTVAQKYGVTRLYAARVLLIEAAKHHTGTALARINTARAALKGMS